MLNEWRKEKPQLQRKLRTERERAAVERSKAVDEAHAAAIAEHKAADKGAEDRQS